MNAPARIVCLALVALIASTSMSAAFGKREHVKIDGPIIELPKPPIDGPKIDVPKPKIDAPWVDFGLGTPADDELTDVADGSLALICVVDGDDLIITNKGEAIPPGTRIEWKAGEQRGAVKLPNGLRSGQKAEIADVLDDAEDDCTARAVL